MSTLRAELRTTTGIIVPLRQVEVVGEVLGGHAEVIVKQRYQNTESKAVEAVYTFPLPAEAVLSGFVLRCAGRRMEGVVQEREEAFRQYDAALTVGHGAALLEQERANVFTVSVGNLLPGEETLLEVHYRQRLRAEEGALRWMLPTLVAPRYIPGTPVGTRTADGWAAPTDRVPDADRITPRSGEATYGLSLDLRFHLGAGLHIESPSHQIEVSQDTGSSQRVRLACQEAALDRDVVIIARGPLEAPLSTALIHRPVASEEPGILALTVVPDLVPQSGTPAAHDVTFLVDVSGSMAGASLPEAQAALRLCLRHLRAGDRFNILAFHSTYQAFAPQLVAYTQDKLAAADAWVQGLRADGGTELLAPLLEAVQHGQDGVVILLTDGQVGNEDEILHQVLASRGRTRIYTFGIGTNVSDALLRDLAQRTGGAVEFIHPGERIEDKVVAQFARAMALRVTDVRLSFHGDFEVSEPAPAELPELVDGEPWEYFAHITGQGNGYAEVHGQTEQGPWSLTIPIDLTTATAYPLLPKCWATARLRDLEAALLTGRRAERMRARIIELAVQYGLASRYTAFLVVEQRTGTRRATGQPETRVVPVHLPAGWEMYATPQPMATPLRVSMPRMVAQSPRLTSDLMDMAVGAPAGGAMDTESAYECAGYTTDEDLSLQLDADYENRVFAERARGSSEHKPSEAPEAQQTELTMLFSQQLASGLWEEAGLPEEVDHLRATARILLRLWRAQISPAHRLYGIPVRKAIEAVITLADRVGARNAAVAAGALGAAWLCAQGSRDSRKIRNLLLWNPALKPFAQHMGSDDTTMLTSLEHLLSV